jgi:hypothetical protein
MRSRPTAATTAARRPEAAGEIGSGYPVPVAETRSWIGQTSIGPVVSTSSCIAAKAGHKHRSVWCVRGGFSCQVLGLISWSMVKDELFEVPRPSDSITPAGSALLVARSKVCVVTTVRAQGEQVVSFGSLLGPADEISVRGKPLMGLLVKTNP